MILKKGFVANIFLLDQVLKCHKSIVLNKVLKLCNACFPYVKYSVFFFFLQWLSTKWGLFHNGVYLHGAIGDLVTLWAFHQPVTAIILHYWHLADNLIQNDLHNCLQSRCYGNAFETVMAFNGRVDKWEVRDVYVFAWWLFNCYPCVTLLHRVDTTGDNL